MEHLINEFMEYLQNEKNISGNTELSYRRDLKKMVAYFDQAGVQKMEEVIQKYCVYQGFFSLFIKERNHSGGSF